jgi:23S rRNA (pseudouridine1915-N3)-methyltransferase
MKIHFWSIGKPHELYVKAGIELFTKRINYYFPIESRIIPSPKNANAISPSDLKKAERESILHLLQPGDFLVILDEKGKQMSS